MNILVRNEAEKLYVHSPFHQPESFKTHVLGVEIELHYILFIASSRTFTNETGSYFLNVHDS